MNCSYCEQSEDIVERFNSETCKALCRACRDVLKVVQANDRSLFLPSGLLYTDTDLGHYKKSVLEMAESFVATGKIPANQTVRGENEPSLNRFRSLVQQAPMKWMPIKDHTRVTLGYGQQPYHPIDYYDGVHRAALATVLEAKVRVWRQPYRSGQDRQYQTLVFPFGIFPGERPHDRWALLPRHRIADKRILDIACSSGMDGIMNCVLSDSTYHGIDVDASAIEDGRRAAEEWGVDAVLKHADANGERFPKSDVLWIFSCAKRIRFETIQRALCESGATTVFVETHREHDDKESERLLRELPVEDWYLLGKTVRVFGEQPTRSLWMGSVSA